MFSKPKKLSRIFLFILFAVTFLLAGCGGDETPNATSTDTATSPTDTAAPAKPATINGEITYEANTPDSTLYVVNIDDPNQYFIQEVPGTQNSDNPIAPAKYSIEVSPGNYQVFAYSPNGLMASAYYDRAGNTLYVLTLSAGETANEINLRSVYPQNPCQYSELPASPDGKFPAIVRDTQCIETFNAAETEIVATGTARAQATEEATEKPGMAIISGMLGYQASPTPTSIIYIVDTYTGIWYWEELPISQTMIAFSFQVVPGTYIIYAHQSDAAGSQAAGFLEPDFSLAQMTVADGQVLDGVTLTFAYPTSPCQRTAIPASPDGRFPTIDKTC